MRAVLQRVSSAEVRVDEKVVGAIGSGLLVLVAVEDGDTPAGAEKVAGRLAELRIFPDAEGRMNRSLVEVGGEVLLVSQFTLASRLNKGRRPSFDRAAPPAVAVPLLAALERALRARGLVVATGRFGAMMSVSLVNEGPVTFVLDA